MGWPYKRPMAQSETEFYLQLCRTEQPIFSTQLLILAFPYRILAPARPRICVLLTSQALQRPGSVS